MRLTVVIFIARATYAAGRRAGTKAIDYGPRGHAFSGCCTTARKDAATRQEMRAMAQALARGSKKRTERL